MFTLTIKNHFGKEKTWNFVEYLFAEQMFEIAKTCIDCSWAILTDAMSGEVIVEWSYNKGETHYECVEDVWE